MAKYTSGRLKNLKIGISSYSENLTSLEVIGKVGIGTTNATSNLYVVGDSKFTGIVTAGYFVGDGSGLTNLGNVIISTSVAYATNAGIATYATSAGIVTYATSSGIATYATSSGIATYATSSGIATYATSSGIATYATSSGIATYATSAGIVTYATSSGIATYATSSGIATYATSSGIATYATSSGIATYATSSGIATALQYSRTFEITGDIVASPISFNGTGNVSLAATIQPNSVALGSDTTGDYVQSVTGTSNQISVSLTTEEGSAVSLSLPNNLVLPQDVTVTRDLQVNRNLNVTGNITIGGTSAVIFAQELKISDPDIVLGVRTDAFGNDISNDNTSNHGGVALASTEGTPLVDLFIAGIETNPATYKKIMWFKSDTFSGLGTDAWLINYAVGIGSTQFPSGTRLAAGNVQFTQNDLAVVRNINASGVITATSGFSGNASSATYATSAGIATYSTSAGIATYATSSGISTYSTSSGIATYATDAGISTYATSSGISTYATSSGVSTSVIGGIASVTQLYVSSGISTLGVVTAGNIYSTGVITATSFSGNASSASYATISGYSTSSGISTYATSSGIATYATSSGISTYATSSGIATYATSSGISTYATSSGISTYATSAGIATYATSAGIATYATSAGIATYATSSGISTYATDAGIATYATSAGIATYATSSGIATYATSAGIATNVISGIASVTALSVSGFSTVGVLTATSIGIGTTNPTSKFWVDGNGYFTGIITANKYYGDGSSLTNLPGVNSSDVSISVIGGIASVTQLSVSGISTFTNGPVIIGGGTSTGTVGQVLQVTGINSSVYIGGNLGIGTANPTTTLTVAGNTANILIGKHIAASNTITLNGSTAIADYNILSTSTNNLFINRPSGKTITFAQANSSHANFDTSNNLQLLSGNLGIGNFTPTYAIDAGAATLNKAGRVGSIIFGTAGNSYGIVGYNAKPSALNAWVYDVTDNASWIQFFDGGHIFYRGVVGTVANPITPLESGRFDSRGNLGIGTTNPTSKLWVNGNGYFTGVTTSGGVNVTIDNHYKIDDTSVLTNNTLGSGVVNSSLTSVGILTQLSVSGISTLQSTTLIGGGTSTGTVGQVLQVTGINSSVYIGGNLGIGTANPQGTLQVGTGITMYGSTGIVSATSYNGSGINLTGIVTSIVAGTNVITSSSTGQITISVLPSSDLLEVMLFSA